MIQTLFEKAGKLFSLASHQRRLLLRAFFWLGWMRLGIAVSSFKRLVADSDHRAQPPPIARLPAGDAEQARAIGWAIRTAGRHTPWESACLVQALAAKRMLHPPGIPGMLLLGVTKDMKAEGANELSAHAWVRCGEDILVGEKGHDRFTVISAFTWGPGHR